MEWNEFRKVDYWLELALTILYVRRVVGERHFHSVESFPFPEWKSHNDSVSIPRMENENDRMEMESFWNGNEMSFPGQRQEMKISE